MIPSIAIVSRHSSNCPERHDEIYLGCRCRKALRWTYNGKQYRLSAKTRFKKQAEQKRREIEARYEAAEAGKPAVEQEQEPVTVEQAIQSFVAYKAGGQKSKPTLSKYRLTLNRLQEYCSRNTILFLREITLEQLAAYRTEWNQVYSTVFGLRNEQSRLRAFFAYCTDKARLISFNPAKGLDTIKVRPEDYRVDPFTEAQFKKILTAVEKTSIEPANKAKLKLLMQVQRWAGLSLIDAVNLQRSELVRDGKNFNIDTTRRKTGVGINVPIPAPLGKDLLKVTNNNRQYFFSAGAQRATSVWDKRYRRVFQTAGVLDGTSHRFRHMFAVSALENGADIRYVAKALGHTLAVCERYYASWSKPQQRRMEAEIKKSWAS